MLILNRGLIRTVLEYGGITFDRMAATHMLKLEKDSVSIFGDSSWINAVHSCSDDRGYWWSATAEVEVFNAES
jgi:hypothetical protein